MGAFLPMDMVANVFSALSTGPAGPASLKNFRFGTTSPQTRPLRASSSSASRGGGSGVTTNSLQKGSGDDRDEDGASAGVAAGGGLGVPIPFSGRGAPPTSGDAGLDTLGGSFGSMSLAAGPRVQPLGASVSRAGNGPSVVSVPSGPQERLVLSMAGKPPLRGPSDPTSVRGRENPSMFLGPRGVPRPGQAFGGGVGGAHVGMGLMLETKGPGRQRAAGPGGQAMRTSAKGYTLDQDLHVRKPVVLNHQSGAGTGRQGFKYKPLGTAQRSVKDDAFGHFQASGASTPIPTHEFQGKSSTRMVSKFHFGRHSANNGRRSLQAETTVEDLKALPGLNTPQGPAQFALCVDQFWQSSSGGAMEDVSYMLKELGNQGEWHKALGLFHWLADKQELLGSARVGSAAECGRIASATISLLGRHGQVDAARNVFERAKGSGMGSNVFTYSALLSAYGRSGRGREALELFRGMRSEGCSPNLVTYNTVIDACGKGGVEVDVAWELFEEMQREGLKPDRITYNSIMSVCSRAGRWREALSVFDAMKQEGVERDVFTHNTVLDALCKAGDLNRAVDVLDSMGQEGVQPNVVSYSTLLDGYGKAGRLQEALGVYEKMKRVGVKPDRVMYNTLLDMYGKVGHIDAALAIHEEMRVAGWKTDVVTYNVLIDMMGKSGRVRDAESMFQRLTRDGLTPNVLTWTALISAYSKAGQHQAAMQALQQFRGQGLKADVVLYSLLIDAHGKHGLVEEALELLGEMSAQGIKPNVVTYNSLIDAYGRRGEVEQAVSTMESMQAAGVRPNNVTFNVMIDAYGKEGRAEEALGMMQQMKATGAAPDSFTFSALIDANGKRGDTAAAIRIFREMQESGVKPNVVTFSAIMNACSRLGSCEEAAGLLQEMQQSDPLVYGVATGLLTGGDSVEPHLWAQAETAFEAVGKCDRNTGVAFINALTDLLWHFGQRGHAGEVVEAACRRGLVENPRWMSEVEGGVDLHLNSVGSALTLLHRWLLELHMGYTEGRGMPRTLW